MNLDTNRIKSLEESELFDDWIYDELMSIEKLAVRRRFENLLKTRAKELDRLNDVSSLISLYEQDKKNAAANKLDLKLSEAGKVINSIDNYLSIVENDNKFKDKILYNSMKKQMEYIEEDGTKRQWSDTDDAEAKRYIESTYFINSADKYNDAMRIVMKRHSYHPLRDYIDSLKWDGISRIQDFLHNWTKCGNNEYYRECSRLLFAGGISRLYTPGEKQEDVIALIGSQGCGKTTLVKWLALDKAYYDDIVDITGKEVMHKLQGVWICEFAELEALKSAKSQGDMKAFISRENDRFRLPYDKTVSDNPRQTFFIATANTRFFIRDKSGGRRFYPIVCHNTAEYLYNNEEFVKQEIRQCWAEARDKFLKGELKPFLKPELKNIVKAYQDQSKEDDWMTDAVLSYVDRLDKTCVLDIWYNGLGNPTYIKPERKHSVAISEILENTGEWKRDNNVNYFPQCGKVRTWRRVNENTDDELNDLLAINRLME